MPSPLRVLAIDTSTPWAGVALLEGTSGEVPEVVAEAGLRLGGRAGAHLLRVVDVLTGSVGWGRDAIDLYAAARGPGSFTGIRVGLGTVRGLALASGRPCRGIVTLAAMAQAIGPQSVDRLPLLDAGRGEVYGARYDAGSEPPLARQEPWLGLPERARDDTSEPALLFGPGAVAHAARLVGSVRPGDIRGVAAAVGRLAWWQHVAGEPDDGMAPMYLRAPDAESGRRRA